MLNNKDSAGVQALIFSRFNTLFDNRCNYFFGTMFSWKL